MRHRLFLFGCLALEALSEGQEERCDKQHSQAPAQFGSDDPDDIVLNGDLFLLQTEANTYRKALVNSADEAVSEKSIAASASSSAPWTFYHFTAVPLILVTVVVAYYSRPQIDSSDIASPYQLASFEFKDFEKRFLFVWGLAVAADWLQGPYVYALYDSFGYAHEDINILFLAGFLSSMIFGTVVGSLADTWGRKRAALVYCVLYIVSCLSKHCSWYPCLLFGRITGGIATSLLFSTFESWLVSEHRDRFRFSESLLRYMFSMMYFVNYLVAIVSGLFAQAFVAALPMRRIGGYETLHYGGNLCPFDLAVVMLCLAFPMICFTWPENYGDESPNTTLQTLNLAVKTLSSSGKIIAICVVVACFEGGMYAFVINWTPALEIEGAPTPPLGMIFSTMMMCCMFGATLSSYLRPGVPPANAVLLTCGTAFMCFLTVSLCVGVPSLASAVYGGFLLFEVCVGMYMPCCGAMKSRVVPEESRAGVYNLFRVPLNIVVCCVVLSSMSLKVAFGMCATLMAFATLAVVPLTHSWKTKGTLESPTLSD